METIVRGAQTITTAPKGKIKSFRDSTTCNISKSPLSFDHAKEASPSRRLNLLGDALPGNDGS